MLKIIRALPKTVAESFGLRWWRAVTCGEKGSWHLTADQAGKPRHHAAFKVNVVDTTGCGDVFHGAYAAALARSEELEERIRFASAAAALKAAKPGAQTEFPSVDWLKNSSRNRSP